MNDISAIALDQPAPITSESDALTLAAPGWVGMGLITAGVLVVASR